MQNGASGSPPTSAAFLPSLAAAASINAFVPPTNGAGGSGEHLSGAGQHGFFTSNRSSAGGAGAAQQAFLPPLQPAIGNGGAGVKRGATLLSDEETSESGGGTPASSAAAPPPSLPSSLLANLPPLAPAPSTSAAPAPTPRRARSSSRTPSVAASGGGAKGKGKQKADSAEPPAVGAQAKGKKAAPAKGGKRTQQVGPDGKPVPKKKKAGRACAACQKAHLTCDDSRPCARCVKKGCPDECIDGARKKAKYLQEVPDELLERGRHPAGSSAPPQPASQSQAVSDALLFTDSTSLVDPALAGPSQPTLTVSPANPQATSQLHHAPTPFFDFSATSASTSNPAVPSHAYDPSSFLSFPPASTSEPSTSSGQIAGVSPGFGTLGLDTTAFGSEAANLEYAILSSMLNGNGFALNDSISGGVAGLPALNGSGGAGLKSGLEGDPMLLDPSSGTSGGATASGSGASTAAGTRPAQGREYSASPPEAGGSGVAGLMTAEEAYRSVTKPYPYAQSYHYLVKHLKERFEKNDILRIIRALATFRPSLIALQMPLTEEDETFVERTFQRTLVELNKLISFSGTPTVVWRRTGEICLVGTEFCLLTGWKREELVGKKYIFELFDTASVVEYYESFAKHAFESTATSITMQCVVLGPDGRPVPCAFCFSVRRDLFSCPFLVIGSFLPILV
ncbi:Transcriptional regulator of nonfermentable carbon utilization [Rhodosporidiobolus nylandii]